MFNPRIVSAVLFGIVLAGPFTPASNCACADWKLDDMVGRDSQGRAVYRARPIDSRFKNPIAEDDERAFQSRARQVIAQQATQKVSAGNTYFENEKRTYGYLMAQVLAGKPQAIRDLQLEDAQAKEWHRETAGIDFYACFTLKHQTRKFFYFGDLLEPDYRRRMLDGAKSWTAQDPLKRPHYAFQKPGPGWGPDQRNSWVDVRSTENLYLMRLSSVYLFAEAAGNREVAAKYKGDLRRYTTALYRVGLGEWDSENYHGHSLGGLCNLYDFAQDDDVRLLAKACLDWLHAAGAVKYYRGAFNGPTKRDYNHPQPHGGSAANLLWLQFGDGPDKARDWESDEVHLITSSYRPPAAVLHLARKNFDKPLELIASKPPYTATTAGDLRAAPEYLETHYFGRSFQMGSLASGTSEDGGDVNGFKIVFDGGDRGGLAVQGVPGPDPKYCGSPAYQSGKVAGPNRVAQYGNLAIWLVRDGKAPWRWVVPSSMATTHEQGVTFLQGRRTWIALRPLGASALRRDDELTRTVATGEKPPFPDHEVLTASGEASQFCGMAIEVGEPESHGDFARFRRQVLAAEVDLAKLAEGVVQYKADDAEKKWLGAHWNERSGELGVWRNGRRHDWKRHAGYLYAKAPGRDADDEAALPPAGPVYSRWGEGLLYVEAGGEAFACQVSEDGQARFFNGRPADAASHFAALGAARPAAEKSR